MTQDGQAAIMAKRLEDIRRLIRLTNQPVGLLINFGGATLKEGVKRIVNDYAPSASPRLRVNRME